MTQIKKPRRRQTDLQPNPGPGWIDDDRVPGSINRAAEAILEYIDNLPDDEKPARSFDEAAVRAALNEPIKRYWADKDYDEREKFSELKVEARQLKTKIARFEKSIKKLSVPLKAALRISFKREYGEAALGEDQLTVIYGINASITRACDRIIKTDLRKSGYLGAVALVAPLWDYWETMMARPFKRSWKDCNTRLLLKDRLGPISFDHPDALFVQTIVKAIDPQSEFSDIRTRLKVVAAERRAADKARSAVAHRPRNASWSTTNGS